MPSEITTTIITQSVHHYIEQLQIYAQYKTISFAIKIDFDLNGSIWGMYTKKGRQSRLRFNLRLCKEFPEHYSEVVAHEVAHYAVDHAFGLHKSKIKPHGYEWKQVMQVLGFSNARATFKHDLSQLNIKQQKRFNYKCQCQQHKLSATRHNRIIKKQRKYFCPKCQTALVKVE